MYDIIMTSLNIYLEELKNLKSLRTDVELARLLGVSKQHIHRIKAGISMGDKSCFNLARALNKEPIELMSLNLSLRTKDLELKEYWFKIYSEYRNS